MICRRKSLCLVIALGIARLGAIAGAAPKGQDESVFLFENRKVALAVPPNFGVASSKNDEGLMTVRIADPKEKATLQIVFAPDPEGHFAKAPERKEKMFELFREYADQSVEKAMEFEELQPKTGAGTYCVFTDANLAGKTKIPAGEFLNYTAGLKAWPGVVAVFTIFSNDTKSKEYLELMKLLRDSVAEQRAPLK